MTNEVEIIVEDLASAACRLSLEVEPGPGLRFLPFVIQLVGDGGSPVAVSYFHRRDTISLILPLEGK